MKYLVVAIPLLLGLGPFDSPSRLVKEGNALFVEEKYEEALEKYDRAENIANNKAPVDYNRGNTLLKKGDIEGAVSSYQKSAAHGDDSVKAKSFYSLGNALYGAGRYGDAANAYKEALRHDPSDLDSRVNLEIALKKVEEQQEQEKQDGEKKKDDEGKGGEDNKSGDEAGDGQEKEEAPRDEKKSEDSRPKDVEGRDEKQDTGRGDKEMTKEEAKRVLESLGDRNMDLQKMADVVKGSGPGRVEKDW